MDDPEAVWGAILAIAEKTSNETVLGALAAGPLEDLIENHGATWIDRLEAEAKSNPRFKDLLVWRSGTPEVWSRIEKARV